MIRIMKGRLCSAMKQANNISACVTSSSFDEAWKNDFSSFDPLEAFSISWRLDEAKCLFTSKEPP